MVTQPFQTREDVEDTLSRLHAIAEQTNQIADYLREQRTRGFRLSYELYSAVMSEMGSHCWKVGAKTPFVKGCWLFGCNRWTTSVTKTARRIMK
jgi:uncharacterized protein (DUF885 family)